MRRALLDGYMADRACRENDLQQADADPQIPMGARIAIQENGRLLETL